MFLWSLLDYNGLGSIGSSESALRQQPFRAAIEISDPINMAHVTSSSEQPRAVKIKVFFFFF